LDLVTPAELLSCTRFAWVTVGKGGYRLGLSGGRAIIAAPTILGNWEVVLRRRGTETISTRRDDVRRSSFKTTLYGINVTCVFLQNNLALWGEAPNLLPVPSNQ
jgi:hypothetical protein